MRRVVVCQYVGVTNLVCTRARRRMIGVMMRERGSRRIGVMRMALVLVAVAIVRQMVLMLVVAAIVE
jgi:hypothetical protein